jgi:hypothetical protein
MGGEKTNQGGWKPGAARFTFTAREKWANHAKMNARRTASAKRNSGFLIFPVAARVFFWQNGWDT